MSSPTRPQIREALRTLVADQRYRDHNHPEHDAYVAHVSGEFKRVYPGPYVPGSSHMYANDPEGGPEAIVHVRAYSQSRDGNVVQVSDHDRAAPGTGTGGTLKGSSDLPKMSNPVANGKMRGCDGADFGCGHYGARRRKPDGKIYPHTGVDIAVEPGGAVSSPAEGTVERNNIDPYGDRTFKGVLIRTDDGHEVRVLYVDPSVKAGDRVKAGSPIGTAQDLSKKHKPRGRDKMTNHVHVDVKKGKDFKDPTKILFP
ncbi:MAG: M23 family metallopeptidase [Rhodospirillales bacterium]|jgi:murein DD-endopeptidase MepM/ murein hydrolase activator NlpD|nr:M23 family metallopeptidase [Rhodospirillales bacterium]